jgi:LysR family glycine cleavage system transcriptional activator
MATGLPPLKAIFAFEAVARSCSVTNAAEELSLTPSAVSHQIAKLEEHLQIELFRRTGHGLILTPAGQRYHQSVSGALAAITAASRSAREGEAQETLRIHSTPSFATLWLMPRLQKFTAEHLDIRISLAASLEPYDFSRVDIDIRYGIARWPDHQVETIFEEKILPLIEPNLKEKLEIRHPDDLPSHALILSELNVVTWPQWFAANGVAISPSTYLLRLDRSHLAIDAAAQGLGIALESNRLAENYIIEGRLTPVFSEDKGLSVRAHHVVYPKEHAKWPRVAAFLDWLKREAQRNTIVAISNSEVGRNIPARPRN